MAPVMYMPLAEAITQLSFLEFLQHCGVSNCSSPQPSQLQVSYITLGMPLCRQTPPCDVFHQVSPQTSVQQDTLSCDVAVQTSFHGIHILSLDAAAQTTSPSTLSQHVSTQMGSRSASSCSVDTCLFRLPYAVWCNMMLLHNFRSRSFSLAVSYSNRSFGPPKPCSSVPATNAGFTCLLQARQDSNSQCLTLSLLLILSLM